MKKLVSVLGFVVIMGVVGCSGKKEDVAVEEVVIADEEQRDESSEASEDEASSEISGLSEADALYIKACSNLDLEKGLQENITMDLDGQKSTMFIQIDSSRASSTKMEMEQNGQKVVTTIYTSTPSEDGSITTYTSMDGMSWFKTVTKDIANGAQNLESIIPSKEEIEANPEMALGGTHFDFMDLDDDNYTVIQSTTVLVGGEEDGFSNLYLRVYISNDTEEIKKMEMISEDGQTQAMVIEIDSFGETIEIPQDVIDKAVDLASMTNVQ